VSVKIRLARHGRKKRPFYRIVVADSRRARDGRFIESLGTYNPISNPAKVQVNQAKAFHWLGEGAQMTGTVEKILERSGVLERYQAMRAGAPLPEEETKISVEIFGHELDDQGSKRKGKRKAAAMIEEEPAAEEAPAAEEVPAEETPAEEAPAEEAAAEEAPAEEAAAEAEPEEPKKEEE